MDLNAPALVKRLRSLSTDTKRTILAKACAFSAARLGEMDPTLSELMNEVQLNGGLTRDQAATAVSFAAAANKKCFDLEESDAPRNEWIKPFSEARLAQAIAEAFAPDAEDEAAALYELLKSLDHGSGLEEFVEQEINAVQPA